MIDEKRKMYREWNELIKSFQNPFEDWKPLINGGKVIFRVWKDENVDKKNEKL